MTFRQGGRSSSQSRPIEFIPHFAAMSLASCLVKMGKTHVLCTANVQNSIPLWMRESGQRGQGWLSVEYSLLPGSTPERSRRERQNLSGRTHEIQRFIGRALRSSLDLKQLGERTLVLDCDVLQADGSTRTASVNGAYVALKYAIDALLKQGQLKTNPLQFAVASVSAGLLFDTVLVDLDYEENLKAHVSLNVTKTSQGECVELQSSAEKKPYKLDSLHKMLAVAETAVREILDEQSAVFL